MPKFRTPLTLRVTLDCKHKVTWGFVSWTCSRCHCWLNNSSFCRVQVSLQVVNLQQQADDLTGSPKCHEKSGEIDFPLGSRVACVVSGSSEVFLESRVGTRREICPWVVAVRVVVRGASPALGDEREDGARRLLHLRCLKAGGASWLIHNSLYWIQMTNLVSAPSPRKHLEHR